jgi:hypothetical protein
MCVIAPSLVRLNVHPCKSILLVLRNSHHGLCTFVVVNSQFDNNPSGDRVKDIVDQWRDRRELIARVGGSGKHNRLDFEGHGVLIVAKETVNDKMPLCLGLGATGNMLQLVPCFEDWVPETLSPHWATGAVIIEETLPHNRWEIGPCTSDGIVQRS